MTDINFYNLFENEYNRIINIYDHENYNIMEILNYFYENLLLDYINEDDEFIYDLTIVYINYINQNINLLNFISNQVKEEFIINIINFKIFDKILIKTDYDLIKLINILDDSIILKSIKKYYTNLKQRKYNNKNYMINLYNINQIYKLFLQKYTYDEKVEKYDELKKVFNRIIKNYEKIDNIIFSEIFKSVKSARK